MKNLKPKNCAKFIGNNAKKGKILGLSACLYTSLVSDLSFGLKTLSVHFEQIRMSNIGNNHEKKQCGLTLVYKGDILKATIETRVWRFFVEIFNLFRRRRDLL